jgi:hypothetical protein
MTSKSRLARAAEAVDRGTTLTERLLAFARRQDLKLEAVDVPGLINGMTDMLRRSLGSTIEIAVELEDGLPAIRTDANQLDLALLNVALNARDAMPDGGRLQIADWPLCVGPGVASQAGVSSGMAVSVLRTRCSWYKRLGCITVRRGRKTEGAAGVSRNRCGGISRDSNA